MEKKHDFSFCPECGVKLDGDEIICSVCGQKLVEVKPEIQKEQPVVPPPPPPANLCPNCGAKVEANELFCNGCGARLTMLNEQKPVTPPPPPVVEPPVVPPVVTEPVPPAVDQTPPPAVNTPPAVTFCPNCGAKIQGNEVFCNECGTKLAAVAGGSPPPPVIEKPVIPPITQNIPPVSQQPVQQQPATFTETPKKKKGLGVFMWILIIFLSVIILGGGAVAFLQYNGNIDLQFLAKYIPSKNTSSNNKPLVEVTHYYVMHSFATTGINKQDAIVSSVIVSKQQYDAKNTAENKFKKVVTNQYPNDFYLFTKNVLFKEYKNMDEALKGHDALIRDYEMKRYNVRRVIVNS